MKLLNFELLVVMLVLTFAATQVSAYDEAVFSNDGGSTIVIDRFSINATVRRRAAGIIYDCAVVLCWPG